MRKKSGRITEKKNPMGLTWGRGFLFDVFGLFGDNFLAPLFSHIGKFFIYDVHFFAGGYFRKENEQIGQFTVQDQADAGRAQHDYQVKNVAHNINGAVHGIVIDNMKQVNKNAGHIKTADGYQFGGVFGIGNQQSDCRQQADEQNDCERQHYDNCYQQKRDKYPPLGSFGGRCCRFFI